MIAIDFAKEHGEDEDESEEVSEPEPQNEGETTDQTNNKNILVDLTNSVKGALFPANVAI